MPKAELRSTLRRRRAALSDEVIQGWSASVTARMVGLDEVHRAEAIHCYASSLPGEVSTDGLISQFLAERRRVLCPRIRAHGQMEHREISAPSDLVDAAFGLREPDPELAPPVDPQVADLIVVPGVAFDVEGGRLGMGGGYYDRFLAQASAPAVGLAFEMQLVDALPMSAYDHRVDLIVTELRVIRCR
ncbi:MAG: 5-formyltetrahydrofolate cyclo-ligase [Chloroflexota bacterium]|nr:5-formyltetrahydrofolate cyclo-ligase [Chloroflexota bacterium]MDE2895003.1 5-formyltetrahydrofolate cyclo-ligase [Chloroflexota bacterium]